VSTVPTHVIADIVHAGKISPLLGDYYVTMQNEPLVNRLFRSAVGTKMCIDTDWEWSCWPNTTADDAKAELAKLLLKIDSVINPMRFLNTSPTQKTLDPRAVVIAEVLLYPNQSYSKGDAASAANQFDHFADLAQLGLYAMTSPCHTNSATAYTCNWSNFPASVDNEVWLDSGTSMHPALGAVFFTKRAGAGMRKLLRRADSPKTKEAVAELVEGFDALFNPYFTTPRIMIDGSVRAAEEFIARHPAKTATGIAIAAGSVAAAKQDLDELRHSKLGNLFWPSQLLCNSTPATPPLPLGIDTSHRIVCGYKLYLHELL
jgi:hypothetical protein